MSTIYFPQFNAIDESANLESILSCWEPYMDIITSQWDSYQFAHEDQGHLRVLFVKTRTLMDKGFYQQEYKLVGNIFEFLSINPSEGSLSLRKTLIKEYGHMLPIPTLVVGLWDFRGDIQQKGLHNLGEERRLGFWDSSIWYRYVPIIEDFEIELGDSLKEIARCWEMNLYRTSSALEYLEFSIRQLNQNYLFNFPGREGHSDGVLPFQYTSEGLMQQEANRLAEDIRNMFQVDNESIRPKWSSYLLDDFAHKSVNLFRDDESLPKAPTKASLIQNLLTYSPASDNTEADFVVQISPSETEWENISSSFVDHLTSTLKNEKRSVFDLIFLDYYLGSVRQEQGNSSAPSARLSRKRYEYGYEFLSRIRGIQNGLQPLADPLNKFWLFPISSFPFAFKSEITFRGDENFTEYWNLSDGGNPINRPQHFRLKVYKLMWEQIKWASGGPKKNVLSKMGISASFFEEINSFLHQSPPERSLSIAEFAGSMLPRLTQLEEYVRNLDKVLPRYTPDTPGISISLLQAFEAHFSILSNLNRVLYQMAFGFFIDRRSFELDWRQLRSKILSLYPRSELPAQREIQTMLDNLFPLLIKELTPSQP